MRFIRSIHVEYGGILSWVILLSRGHPAFIKMRGVAWAETLSGRHGMESNTGGGIGGHITELEMVRETIERRSHATINSSYR